MDGYEKRYIPLSIKILSYFRGFSSQFGWIFFGFGMLFVWFFVFNADLSSIFPKKYDSKTSGFVIDSIPTSMSENSRRIYKITFRFTDRNGKEHISSSFQNSPLQYNKKVQIVYKSGNLSESKIKGSKMKPFGPMVLFVLIFPAVGLIFIFTGILHCFKVIRLLQYGIPGQGIFLDMKSTHTSINNRKVYKFRFQFTDRTGREHTLITRTHRTELLTGSKEKRLLYLPENPSYGIMIDLLPQYIKIDLNGNIEFSINRSSYSSLIIPAIAIISNSIIAYIRFSG